MFPRGRVTAWRFPAWRSLWGAETACWDWRGAGKAEGQLQGQSIQVSVPFCSKVAHFTHSTPIPHVRMSPGAAPPGAFVSSWRPLSARSSMPFSYNLAKRSLPKLFHQTWNFFDIPEGTNKLDQTLATWRESPQRHCLHPFLVWPLFSQSSERKF